MSSKRRRSLSKKRISFKKRQAKYNYRKKRSRLKGGSEPTVFRHGSEKQEQILLKISVNASNCNLLIQLRNQVDNTDAFDLKNLKQNNPTINISMPQIFDLKNPNITNKQTFIQHVTRNIETILDDIITLNKQLIHSKTNA